MTPAEFLLARIAEDEAVDRWGNPYNVELHAVDCAEFTAPRRAEALCSCSGPSRWRLECEAKRRLVSEALALDPSVGEVLLRILALPYGEHPDFREEWRPHGRPNMAS